MSPSPQPFILSGYSVVLCRFKLDLPDEDSAQLIRTKAFAKGVLAVPGTMFFPNARRSAYVRAAFSVLDIDLADEGLRRLATVVKEIVGSA